MKHFVGTRFNLKVNEWKTTKTGSKVLSRDWLKKRFDLFEKYCLPSFKNQSNKNFIWCVFFDIDTPSEYKDRIKLIEEEFINFKPIFIDGIENLNKYFIDFILDFNGRSNNYVITTRVDNDDIIHRDFIKTIQELYIPVDKTVIDLRKGFQLTLNRNKPLLLYYSHPFNAFVSVVENVESLTTIYSKMHYDWKLVKNVLVYKKTRLWIELVHEENKINDTLPYLKKPLRFENFEFELKNQIDFSNSLFSVLSYNFFTLFKHKQLRQESKRIKKLSRRIYKYVIRIKSGL